MAAASVVPNRDELVAPVLAFLRCRTSERWVAAAVADLRTLLVDHASLELRAAEQAQKIIRRYSANAVAEYLLDAAVRISLLQKLSRLAREELRHFEQVIDILTERDIPFVPVTASRYARSLHEAIRPAEPERCIDTLIVGAIIEARSCERFYSLLPALAETEPDLGAFYASLLRSEARHYEDYLALARTVSGADLGERIEDFLDLDAELVTSTDTELRFHSGPLQSS